MPLMRPNGAPLLGPQEITIERFDVYPSWGIDAVEGGVIPGPFDVHLRVVFPKQHVGVLLPCTRLAMRGLVRSIDKFAASGVDNATGGNN